MPEIKIGKKYFLMREKKIVGALVFQNKNGIIVPFIQEHPDARKERLSGLAGEHAHFVFSRVRDYLAGKELAIHLMPERITEFDFRDALWELFKRFVLPADLLEKIILQAEKEYKGRADRKTRGQIDVFKKLKPVGENKRGKVDYTRMWKSWLRKWKPKK